MMFHVSRLSNMNAVVSLCFASQRLLRAMSVRFHASRLSNKNVAVPLFLAFQNLLHRNVNDVSCVAAIKRMNTL